MNTRCRSVLLAGASLLAFACGTARVTPTTAAAPIASADGVSIIPRPISVVAGSGSFALRASTEIWSDADLAGVARQLARYLEPATGLDLSLRSGTVPGSDRIVFRHDANLGAEAYRLEVTPAGVVIDAGGPAGAFYAVQTIRQLLPADILREAPIGGVAWMIPAVTIDDAPRFQWRGMHLDVSRHFMPKEFVKKFIDLLALHKMNSFHWHLTDDQGWRIEITRYPKLTEIGAWRAQTLVGRAQRDTLQNVFDGQRHGGFYTQDDVREVVAYAKARFVNVVPEIEMPGHAQEMIAAYPELGVTGNPVSVRQTWGVSAHILKPSDSTITFMQNVLEEVLTLFPGSFIHIGGDEATKTQWRASGYVQDRIKQLGLRDENELQSWFIRQMDTFLTARGRRLIGWDEILEGGLAPNAAVMSWRGVAGGIAAAREGHDVVMTPTSHTYFDYYQSRDRAAEPMAFGGFLPLDTVYAYEPVPADLEPEFAKHILGAQGQLWSEYIPNQKQAEYMAFPRLAALAEVVWTPVARRGFVDFKARLVAHGRRLDALDVNYRG